MLSSTNSPYLSLYSIPKLGKFKSHHLLPFFGLHFFCNESLLGSQAEVPEPWQNMLSVVISGRWSKGLMWARKDLAAPSIRQASTCATMLQSLATYETLVKPAKPYFLWRYQSSSLSRAYCNTPSLSGRIERRCVANVSWRQRVQACFLKRLRLFF